MVSARRVSLFQREIRISLSSAAIEILFDLASVMSEGGAEDDCYFGSTMITIDLARAAHLTSDECDEHTARRIAELIGKDDRVRERAYLLGSREAMRLAEARLTELQIDLRVRRTGRHLHLDIDIEASVEETP